MRTEMTKGVGYDKFWDTGGGKYVSCVSISGDLLGGSAVYPSEAAKSTLDFIDDLEIKDTGTFWAPRGPRSVLSSKHYIVY